jgi:aspartyl-tRNA(Asn)/glutamyl-tRNA(Gln) amidotransferase subunit C
MSDVLLTNLGLQVGSGVVGLALILESLEMSNSSENGIGGIDVAYVAHLARLNLNDEEVAHLQPQMEQIVGFVKKIDELDIADVEPTAHAAKVVNVLREDVPGETLDHEVVMANAPQEADGLFAVPKIIE